MRSVKKTGGLTRGSCMIELANWLLSMPTCAEIKRAIHSLLGKQVYSKLVLQ